MGKMSRVRLPVLEGLLLIGTSLLGPDALAGVTLAALAVPEVLGYASIAGMPVVTGLYTNDGSDGGVRAAGVLPASGGCRGLGHHSDPGRRVVGGGQDSPRFVQLAGTAALLVGGMLLAAR
jgi:hypothetical protein